MQIAEVIGHATATVKHPDLTGWKLLVVQVLDAKGGAEGEPLIVIDSLGCGRGDRVVLTSDGKEVRTMMNSNRTPVRWAVIGLADTWDSE